MRPKAGGTRAAVAVNRESCASGANKPASDLDATMMSTMMGISRACRPFVLLLLQLAVQFPCDGTMVRLIFLDLTRPAYYRFDISTLKPQAKTVLKKMNLLLLLQPT